MKRILIFLAAVMVAAQLHAEADVPRFCQKLKLPNQLTAVVAEGDLEARSLGSYTVRLYSSANAEPGDDTTFYVAGILRERSGAIEKVSLADIDGDGKPEVVVTIRCVGTGQYLSAEAFAFDEKRVWLRAAVADLAADANPITALQQAKGK